MPGDQYSRLLSSKRRKLSKLQADFEELEATHTHLIVSGADWPDVVRAEQQANEVSTHINVTENEINDILRQRAKAAAYGDW